jgi:hypothetical protein
MEEWCKSEVYDKSFMLPVGNLIMMFYVTVCSHRFSHLLLICVWLLCYISFLWKLILTFFQPCHINPVVSLPYHVAVGLIAAYWMSCFNWKLSGTFCCKQVLAPFYKVGMHECGLCVAACGSHGLADGLAARLVGGDGATNGQWPSVALLYHTRHKSSCTASIISPKWLLSSYSCLHLR